MTAKEVLAAHLDVSDDCHGLAHVVKGGEKDVGGLTVHATQRVGKLVQQLKGLLGKVNPDVARVANVLEQIAQRVEAGFFFVKLVHVAQAHQGLKVGKGDCC